MGGPTFQIILQIASAYLFFAPLASATLGGGKDSVCYSEKNRTELRLEFYHEYYLKRVWSFIPWYSYRIHSKLVNRTETAVEQICCPGYMNVTNVCQRESCRKECTNPQYDNCQDDGNKLRQEFSMICDHPTQGWGISPWLPYCFYDYLHNKDIARCLPHCPSTCENGLCTEPEICACHPDYRMEKNNKCVPLCDRKCENGNCVGVNKCSCNEGWKGDFCEIALFCTIARAEEGSEFSRLHHLTEQKKGNVTASPKFPVCDLSCLDYVNDTTLSNYSYIPIDSECNTDSQQWFKYWMKYGFLVPLILVVIVLLIFTISITRCILRKSKPLNPSISDCIPLTSVKPNIYEVDNHIYATIEDR